MDSWWLDIGDEGGGLAADALPVGLALTAADGSVRRVNAALRDMLGRTPPDEPEALVALLLAAGVPDPRAKLEASVVQVQDLVLRRGVAEQPVRLVTRTLSGGERLHLFHDLRIAHVGHGSLSDLQSLIAHDLRSPLAVIQGYAGLLATGRPGPLNTTQAEFLAGIDAKIVELTRLLDDFLDLSRLEAGALQLRLESVGLAELIDRVCDELARAAGVRRIELSSRIDPVELELVADPLRLKQVLENLVVHAVKDIPEGGWVRVEATLEGCEVRIAVRGGGPGVEPADPAAGFEPCDSGQAGQRAAGSGLGLAVVQRLVALHGGFITAAGAPGAGATFTVVLPRHTAATPTGDRASVLAVDGVQESPTRERRSSSRSLLP